MRPPVRDISVSLAVIGVVDDFVEFHLHSVLMILYQFGRSFEKSGGVTAFAAHRSTRPTVSGTMNLLR